MTMGDEMANGLQLTKAERPLVLLAEDDDEIRWALVDFLINLAILFAILVTSVPNGNLLAEALRQLLAKQLLPDVIVTDHRMPGRLGIDVLASLSEHGVAVPVIVITAFGADVGEKARALGARAVFQKPFDPDDLRTAVWFWSAWSRNRSRSGPSPGCE